jgi:hypothetical protein
MNQEMDQDKIEIQMKIDAMFEILLDYFEKHENEDYGPSKKEERA